MHESAIREISTCSASSGPTNRRQALLAALLVLFASAGALAAPESPGTFELTPYGGYRFGGAIADRSAAAEAELADDGAFGLIVNLRDSPKTQWELIVSRQATTADVSDFDFAFSRIDLDLETIQLGGTYLGEGERLRPYLAATIGGTRLTPTLTGADDDTFWSFSVGGGLQVFPAARVGLRVEARLWGTLLDADSDLFCVSDAAGGACAFALDGRMLWQLETFAGLVLRF